MNAIRIAIGMVVRESDKAVLIARRHADAHLGGYWEFPGGKCEEAELPIDAVRRELVEEVGIDVVVEEAWPAITHAYPDRTVEIHPFVCRAVSGEARAIGSVQIVWAPVSELTTFAFPDANSPLVDRLVSEHNNRL